MEDGAALLALQEELMQLKAKYGKQVLLKRTTPQESPLAPFPITVTCAVTPPAAAELYDVSDVCLRMQLLGPPASKGSHPKPADLVATVSRQQLHLEVLSNELPLSLRERMAQRLHAWWSAHVLQQALSSAASTAAYRLGAILDYLHSQFVPLITCMPSLLEPYETVDASGATVRRYTIVYNDAESAVLSEVADSAVPQPAQATPLKAAAQLPAVAAASSGAASSSNGTGVISRSSSGVKMPSAGVGLVATVPAHTHRQLAPAGVHSVVTSTKKSIIQGNSGIGVTSSSARLSPAGPAAAVVPPAGPAAAGVPPAGLAAASRALEPAGGLNPSACSFKPSAAIMSTATWATASMDTAAGATACPHTAAAAGSEAAAGVVRQHVPSQASSAHTAPHVPFMQSALADAHLESLPAVPAAQPAESGSSVPPLLLSYEDTAKDLLYLQKRYGHAFEIRLHRDGSSSSNTSGSSRGGQHAHLAAGRTMLHQAGLGGSSSSAAHLLQPDCLTTFELHLDPTDRAWERPSVWVVGQLLPTAAQPTATATATASITGRDAHGTNSSHAKLARSACYMPSLGIHMACRLPGWLKAAIERVLDQQLQLAAEAQQSARHAYSQGPTSLQTSQPAGLKEISQQAHSHASSSQPLQAAVTLVTAIPPSSSSSRPAAPEDAATDPSARAACAGVGADVLPGAGVGSGVGAGVRPGGRVGPQGRLPMAIPSVARPAVPGTGSGAMGPHAAAAGSVGTLGGTPHAAQQPQGVLRSIFKYLENYAGSIAAEAERAAFPSQHTMNNSTTHGSGALSAASGSSSQDDGSSSDDEGYSDDGYGDGSRAPHGGVQYRSRSSLHADGHARDGNDASDSDKSGDGSWQDGADEVRFSGQAGEGAGAAAARKLRAADSGVASFAVSLEGLRLDGVAVAEVIRAQFEVTCSRCSQRAALTLDSEAISTSSSAAGSRTTEGSYPEAAATCAQCHAPMRLRMRPSFLTDASNVLGLLHATGCRPTDLLPSWLAAQCADCGSVMSLRGLQVGMPLERGCSTCHRRLATAAAAVSFTLQAPPSMRSHAQGHGSSSSSQQAVSCGGGSSRRHMGGWGGLHSPHAVMTVGQPLPDSGTCKHYRHSYRWLRFPCCGMRFACDLCHEEGTADGHPARWATRMVCGWCSMEQGLDVSCAACGRKLAGRGGNYLGRNTRFWEGGEGCRDPRFMHRNDPRKHRGKNKTQSAKANRVGPKAYSKENKNAAAAQ